MADLTIHELQNEATSPAANDYMVLDGATAGTRKITPANLATWIHNKWAAFINALTSKTSFANGDKFPVVNGSTATAMESSKLLELTAQNALGSIKDLSTTKYKGFMALDDADGTGKMDVGTIFNNFASEFVPNETNAIAGMPYIYNGKVYIANEDYNGSFDSSKFTRISIDELIAAARIDSIAGSDDTAGYATISLGNLVIYDSVAGVKCKKYSLEKCNEYVYLTARRKDSTYTAIGVFVGVDGTTALGYVSLTESDYVWFGKYAIPSGAKYIIVNYLPGIFDSVVMCDAVTGLNELKDNVKTLSDSQIVELSASTTSGYTTVSGGKATIISLAGWNYAKVDVAVLQNAKRIRVKSTINSSQSTVAVVFSDAWGHSLGTASSASDSVDVEVSVPTDTKYVYVNSYGVGVQVSLNFVPNFFDTIVNAPLSNISSSQSFYENFKGILGVKVYTDYPNKLFIKKFGYDSANSKFVVEMTNDAGSKVFYAERRYDSRPTSSRDVVSFIASNVTFCYIEVLVDWTKYSDYYYDTNDYVTTIATLASNELEVVRGYIHYDYAGYVDVPTGVSLVGNGCTIEFSSKLGGLRIGSGTRIDGITFVDGANDTIVRESYSAEEIAEDPMLEYLYRPIVDVDDLADEQPSLWFGENSNFVIYVKNNASNASIENCTFKGFNRCAVNNGAGSHKDAYHNVIFGNLFFSCRCGLYAGEQFARVACNQFVGCIIGLLLNSGNFNAVNNNFTCCDCGMYFNSQQSAHGEISTFEFAHCGLCGIYAKVIGNNLGFIVTNCQFAQADIIIEAAWAFKLSSCRLDNFISIANGYKNSIIGCNMRDVYAVAAGHESMLDVPADTLVTLNRALDGNESDSKYNVTP